MDTIGGFRLVRVIGAGTRAQIHLGHSRVPAKSEASLIAPGTAAIKVYRPTTSIESIDTEIEALARASSPHLLRLEDLATGPDGRPVAVLGLLRSISAGQLLLDRGQLPPGEVVTLLAPLTEAVAELHRVGVAHGRLRLGSIFFDSKGAPVIGGFGSAALVGPMPLTDSERSLTPAEASASEMLTRDLSDLGAIVRTVLDATVASAASGRVLEWVERVDVAADPDRFLDELNARLFDLAAPQAIQFEASRAVPPPANRLRPAHSAGRGPKRRPAQEVRVSPPSYGRAWLNALAIPDWVTDSFRIGQLQPRAAVSRAREFLAPVRRPVWIAAGAAALSLIAALVLVPSDPVSSDTARNDPAPLSTGPVILPEEVVPTDPAAPAPSLPGESSAEAVAIVGDDPLPAASALLALRYTCIADRSVLCLDATDQANSAAWEADSGLIRRLQEGAVVENEPWAGATPALLERLGDSALLTLTAAPPAGDSADKAAGVPSATLLMVRGADGWRIRDLIVDDGTTGPAS